MVSVQDFSVLSSDKKTNLHGMKWKGDGEVKAVLQLVHGVSEYIQRYDEFAKFLADKGIVVFGHDNLGHGKSVNAQNIPIFFGEGNTWETAVNDIAEVRKHIKSLYPDKPIFLLGHSMGSFLVRSFMLLYPSEKLSGCIIMGTAWQPTLKLKGAKLIASFLARKKPGRVSGFANNLAFGEYNKPFNPNRTEFDWLSKDTANVDSYIADPLCGQPATVGLFREMVKGMSFNQNMQNLKKMNLFTPVFFVAGSDDPVGDMGVGVKKAHEVYSKLGIKDCSIKLYPDLRHEILNEGQAKNTVFADILTWLNEH